ncbi:sacsin-like [Stylophora pistillata]|uniref:sacsin-like n=1 Tax=Stylophora pistillata TaxID=50429 RepID=UPI000C043324|nr:sacsin-like [Stylophora pistillata]
MLLLLEFVLEDKNLNDMHGVPLLPLANGGFVDFRSLQYNREPDAAVYVSSTSTPRSIFHNMDNKFLDDKVQTPGITYLSKLASDANSLHTIQPVQLVRLNEAIAVKVLREMLPPEWCGGNHTVPWYPGKKGHPPEHWLESVWIWIKRMFPTDLSLLENLPLIPHTCAGNQSLVKLSLSSVVILRHQHQSISLPPLIASLLGKIGCIVLENLPWYIYHNTLHKYVATPDPRGVLKIFCTLGQSRCASAIPLCSPDEKRALRSFLSSAYFNDDEKSLLYNLPIFDAADGNAFISIRNGFQVHEVSPYGFEVPRSLPIPRASSVVALRDSDSYTLIQRLGISPMTKTTFLKNIVFTGIQSNFYSHQQISTLMSWILSQYSIFCEEDSSFHASLQQLPFVITRTNKLVTPFRVLDPHQPILEQLFENENDKFPNGDFVKDEILPLLRQLGMRSIPNKEDILQVAKTVDSVHSDVGSRRALALLEFLDKNPPDKSLGRALMNERWVPRKQSRPSTYPSAMPWFLGTKNFYKPSEMFSQSKATLVGVLAPIVPKPCSKALEDVFDWNKSPPVHHLLEQLRAACSVQLNDGNESVLYHFQAMVKQIYEEASTKANFLLAVSQENNFPEWIWHGNGFTSPSKIAFTSCCGIDLKPYLHIVPPEFRHLSHFFRQCGVRDTFQDSDLLHLLIMIKDKHDTRSEYLKDVEDDRKLSHEILHWIIRDGKQLDPELRESLLVPIHTRDNTLKLVPCSECTFCDADWLRKGGSELLIESEFPMIHESISSTTATLLGVPPISTRVTSAEALGIEQTGPYEPITTRLKNILNEYKAGVGVFKELLQNGDDAGATEVQFILDWRNHPNQRLLSPGMEECQGPALLAYNNATFTDDDLKNISRLAGATKEEDLEKIGRFGLGFSSVYHFTDVPNFITRSYAVFFDPETTHLGLHIKDASKPGIKIDLAVNQNSLTCFPDQFAPYNGLFGCETAPPSDHDKFYFQGTLFRFPFRTKRGKISDKIFTKQEIRSFMFSFQESSPTLLLFSQNVKKVSFFEVHENATNSKDSQLLFEICIKPQTECIPFKNYVTESTFLKSCVAWTKQSTSEFKPVDRYPSPKLTELISVCSTICHKNGQKHQETQSWLVTSCLGIENSFRLATSEEGKKKGFLSASGVAAKMSTKGDGLEKGEAVPGEVFCVLPLGIPTGLPVHVNGYFSVTSNRRGIWDSTTTDVGPEPIEVRWNQSLMEDALTQAYVHLLDDMIVMKTQGKISSYDVFSLWPNPDKLQSFEWEPLIRSFYRRIASCDLPLVCTGGKWLPVTQCIYQDLKLRELVNSEIVLEKFDYKIVQLPDFARKGFWQAGCMDVIDKRTMTQEKFLQEVFFPNITMIPKELRDPIVCHLIDECLQGNASNQCNHLLNIYESLLTNNRCIPCGPDTGDLASPKELVSPKGVVATLFSAEDRKFPVGSCYLTRERLFMLQNLGMLSDILDWETLIERGNSVSVLCKRAEQDAKKRSALLIDYINVHLQKMDPPSELIREELMATSMFPTLAKPANYVMPWRGTGNWNSVMLPAKEMYDERYKFVAGSSRPILDESESCGCGKLSEKTRDIFGFSSRKPSAQEVLEQLEHTVQAIVQSPDAIESLEEVFPCLYEYFQELILEPDGKRIICALQEKEWILVHGNCLSASRLAFTWKRFGEPYLNEVPQNLASKYRSLFQATGVKEHFTTEEVISALYELDEEKRGKRLSTKEFKVSKSLLEEISEASDKSFEKERGKIPLPDHNLFLQPAEKLAINDAPWVVAKSGIDYVHKDLSIDLAHRLGAIDIRTKKLDRISRAIGREFGQREDLTDRLKGILKAYPCDVGVLKELVQNADDAGATEIHFIVDPRNHPTNQLLSNNWKELQGPALCVYNNRPFSEKDLEGIQRLGIGSKADDPSKTGQYGIGFNAVYHLTDCPSFISNEDTLCILDPHCRYAPGASKENPGRLIGPIGEEERSDYRDVFPCYLENMFDLKSATMFRFPLRRGSTSSISQNCVSYAEMMTFMNLLAYEAKEILLFLNYVKTITLSEIKGDQLKEIYSVSAQLTQHDEAQRLWLANHIKASKDLETNKIDWLGITYLLLVQEKGLRQEKWLIHQCIGLQASTSEEAPNGRSYGLLPRGGIAAKVSGKSNPEHKAFCFLPLPVNTGLPVHVNGHFYLDSARRNLWQDEKEEGFGSQWNHFIKTKVLSQAYISVMLVARGHLPGSKERDVTCFSTEYNLHKGMQWYHNLFPNLKSVQSQWKVLGEAVFKTICNEDAKLLPLTKKTSDETMEASQVSQAAAVVQVNESDFREVRRCFWLPPSQGFFNNLTQGSEFQIALGKILLRVGFKLLYSSATLFWNFKEADTNVREITPEFVIQFLKENPNSIGDLPCPVEETTLGSVKGVLLLLGYCMEAKRFPGEMLGTPLLLTEDNVLRRFNTDSQVFLSLFADLVPTQCSQFIHHTLVTTLLRFEEGIFAPDQSVLRKFDIMALASLLPSTANAPWCETSDLIPWNLNEQPSESWMQRLWEFLHNTQLKTPNTFSLDPLQNWPILPTKSGKLAPLSKGKVILDLTRSDSWSPGQEHVAALLRKLNCPEVNVDLISGNGRRNVSDILKAYVSYPNSSQDTLKVLDHLMREGDISNILFDHEKICMLQFFQDDLTTLKQDQTSTFIVKRLPFFKTFHGASVSLANFKSVYEIPVGLPTDESEVWMTGYNCVFFAPEPRLSRLYKDLLGVGDKTHTDCYINFIFPKFSLLQKKTRMLHLEYVRRILLAPNCNEEQQARILKSLSTLAFIPDANGTLQTASYFHDPGVKVFAVMLPCEARPPEPFDTTKWLELLRKIGLKQKISKALFQTFANEVASQAIQMSNSSYPSLEKKSKTLVEHLLTDDTLHDAKFLVDLSTIKFIACPKASGDLSLLCRQHLVPNRDEIPPFGHFKHSIPHTQEALAWTTASLLFDWAIPNPRIPLLKNLQVFQKPSLQQVIGHIRNLSQTLSRRADREQPEHQRRLLSQIMTEVYRFLTDTGGCNGTDSNEPCSAMCDTICNQLSDIPCVLVEGGRVFVRGKQLAFHLDEEHPPYLYKVPKEYGIFEHLFKRLGAMEKATPTQFAQVLSNLRNSCQDKQMHANELRVVKKAVFGLFTTLHATICRKEDRRESNPLAEVNTLHLPNSKQELRPSTELVLFDCPQFKHRLSDSMFEFLDDLTKYNLTMEKPGKLVDLLPDHLKTKSLASMVREELQAECRGKNCRADVEGKCGATNHFRHILYSPDLANGIVRILKSQYDKAKLTEEVCNKVRSFQKALSISCMETLSTELVDNKSNTVIPKSQRQTYSGCFVGQDNGKKHIFIQHGAKSSDTRRKICHEIYSLTGCLLEEENLLHLAAILECTSPADISITLDNAGVSDDAEATQTPSLEPILGSEVPKEFHELLDQYNDFYFRPGEFVAYEREDSTDEEPKYIYANIVRQVKTSTSAKVKKDRTKRKQKGESNLLSRYLIDIGPEREEVDVLDLYKFRRPRKSEEEEVDEKESLSKSMEVVPYVGASGQSTGQAGAETAGPSRDANEPLKPQTLEHALKEVKKALTEIWKFPEDKRKKAIKRLYLRWHPDKNMDMQDTANEVMKFIQNDVDRLSKEGGARPPPPDFTDFFKQWNERARRERSSHENYRRRNPRFPGFASHSRRTYTAPNPRVAKIWMRQSKEDLRSVKHLLSSRDPLYYLVCFQCHQIAEKSLKAALYALSGVADWQLNSHDLVLLARDLSRLPRAPDVTAQVARLSNYFEGTRYPNKHEPAKVPAEVFQDSQEVQESFRLATEVLEVLEQFVGA